MVVKTPVSGNCLIDLLLTVSNLALTSMMNNRTKQREPPLLLKVSSSDAADSASWLNAFNPQFGSPLQVTTTYKRRVVRTQKARVDVRHGSRDRSLQQP